MELKCSVLCADKNVIPKCLVPFGYLRVKGEWSMWDCVIFYEYFVSLLVIVDI